MKTRLSATWGLSLALLACFATGASAQNVFSSARAGTSAPAPATPPAGSPTVVAPVKTTPLTLPPGTPKHQPKSAPVAVSPWFDQVAKMVQAGIEPEPLLAFIDSAGTFNLGADQIIYLRDLGVPNGLITAMIQHDSDLAMGYLPLLATAVPALPPPLKTIVVATNATPAAATVKAPAAPVQVAAAEPNDEGFPYLDYMEGFYYDEPPAPPEPAGFSPVRKPYPVQLTDPIIVVRAPERLPNVVVIQMP